MPKRKELTQEKIPKLLLKQSLPAGIGMLVMTLYNVVDTIFIGKGVGTLGLTAVTLAFPITIAIGAISQTFGIGFSTLISRSLGAKDYTKAKTAFGNYLCISLISGLLITIIGESFLNTITNLLGTNLENYNYTKQYLKIIIASSSFFVILQGSNAILRSIGEAKKAMNTMIIAAILNIIFDALFILYFKLGVSGAALATGLSWFLGTFYTMFALLGKKGHLKISKNNLILEKKVIKESLLVGASSFARQISSSIMIFVLNLSLVYYSSDIMIAAFGVVMRVVMLSIMPIMGVVQGSIPIIGTNYGAKKNDRVKEVTKLSIKTSTIISLIAFFIVSLFPLFLIKVFTSDPELIKSSSTLIKIIVLGFPVIGFQMVIGGYYQALGQAKAALIVSMLRQIIIFIPSILILPLFFGANGIYFSFPISDILAGIITYFIFIKSYKNL